MTDPLLMTKLFLPSVRGPMVPRSRLVDRLLAVIKERRKLLLVSAPAGFGKTTLVVDAVSQAHIQTAWYSLDEGDNDLIQFWRYAITSLRRVVPQVGDLAQSMLEANQTPPIENTLTVLLNDLVSLSEPVLLVLDDYHVIHNQTVHESLVFFLDHLIDKMIMVITTRSDPPLSLSRRRGRGEMFEFRSSDLRFTHEEAVNFINNVMKVGMLPEDMEVLVLRTEGWPAGLQLAALAMQGLDSELASSSQRTNLLHKFVSSFAGDDHYVGDYLIEEVLLRQPKQIQEFLLHTSILEKFCSELCAAVLISEDPLSGFNPLTPLVGDSENKDSILAAQAMLSHLKHANLFLIALDNRQEWFRYHPLFADLLQHQLVQARGVDYSRKLHLKASNWFERNGYWSEAINHALKSGDENKATDIVAGVAIEMFKRSELLTLLEWIHRLPEDLIRTKPGLLISWGWASLSTGRPREAIRAVQTLEKALNINLDDICSDPKSLVNFPSYMQLLLASALMLRISMEVETNDVGSMKNRVLGSIQILDNISTELTHQTQDLRSVAFFNLGLSLEALGDLEPASDAFHKAVEYSVLSGNLHILPMALSQLAQIYLMRGEIKAAKETYHQALEQASVITGKPSPLVCMAHAGLGQISYEQNEIEDAQIHFGRCLALAKPFNNWASLLPAYIGMARLYWSAHDRDELVSILHEADQFWQNTSRVEGYSSILAWKGILLGDQTALRSSLAMFDKTKNLPSNFRAYFSENESILNARMCARLDDIPKALAILEKVALTAESGERWNIVIQNLVLQSVIFDMSNKSAEAVDCMQRALELAEPHGYVRTFVDEGQSVAKILGKVIQKNKAGSSIERYASHLLDVIVLEYDQKQAVQDNRNNNFANGLPIRTRSFLIEPLTERELEILDLIAGGNSNHEIASRLVITQGTVKVHTNNIYSKLGVNSRTAAVARARELKLIP